MKNLSYLKVLVLVFVFSSNIGFTEELKNFKLFSTPENFEISNIKKNNEFGKFDNNGSNYYCKKTPCTQKNSPIFDNNGNIKLEGNITEIEYKIANNTKFSKLQIIKSYEKAIVELGGKRLTDDWEAVANLFAIENEKGRYWININPSYGENKFLLTVIQAADFKQLVTAKKLSEDIAKNGFVTLNVNFDNNKAIIKDADKPTINEVVTLLKNDAKLKLSVEGHTDNVGSATANKTLSQNRADSLVAYMVTAGINANRLVAKGFGSEAPIADNRTEDGRAKNRRVELVKMK